MILAGDIGGTNTRLALCEPAGKGLRVVSEARFPSRDHAGLVEIVQAFLAGAASGQTIELACFGIAGPVKDGRCEATNLPWVIDARVLALALGVGEVTLLNDLEANAYGIGALGPDDLVTLNPGAPGARGNAAVIAAGTGLGEAGLFWDGHVHRPFATEGGHMTFAPRNDLEIDLLRYLLGRWPHVSFERVVSGPGLVNVYEFLRDTGRGTEDAAVAAQMKAGDPAAAVSRAALEGRSPLCGAALDLFVSLYGSEAGNLALKTFATAGVYVAGGIAVNLADTLASGPFIEAYLDKGRFRALLEKIPVAIVLDTDIGLAGSRYHASL